MAVLKFKHPDKKPHDSLLASDPLHGCIPLNPEARKIYLRIVRESEPGVLLQCDRIAVELTAQLVDLALSARDGDEFVIGIKDAFDQLLAPKLGEVFINQVMAKR